MKVFGDKLGNKFPVNDKFPERFSEGEQGDFYVENGVCIACGAPEAEAPDLIEHSERELGHCYFKKQPRTNDELDRAINALQVSCIAGIRYGGKDETILKRLYQMGLQTECDQKPIGDYKIIIINKVTFQFAGTIKELSDLLLSQILTLHTSPNKKIIKHKTNNVDYFEFIYRWTPDSTGIVHKCNFNKNGETEIEMSVEKKSWLSVVPRTSTQLDVRWASTQLNMILKHNSKVQDTLWFDLDGNTYDQTQPMY